MYDLIQFTNGILYCPKDIYYSNIIHFGVHFLDGYLRYFKVSFAKFNLFFNTYSLHQNREHDY